MFSGVAASLRSSKTILCRQPAWLLWTPKKLSHSGFLKQQFWNHPLQVSYMFGDMSEYVLIKLKHDWSYDYSTIHGCETLRLPRIPRLLRLRGFQDSRDSKTSASLEAPRLPTSLGNMMSHTGKKLSTVWICCGCLCRHRSKGCSKAVWLHFRCVLCDFIFKKRRNFNVHTSCFVLTIHLGSYVSTYFTNESS